MTKKEGEMLKDIKSLIEQLDTIDYLQDQAKITEIARKYKIKRVFE